jgi:hypothetical protein
MIVGIYGCRTNNLWLWEQNNRMWEQKPMDVGTKTYFFGNKTYVCGNNNLWLWEQIYGLGTKKRL